MNADEVPARRFVMDDATNRVPATEAQRLADDDCRDEDNDQLSVNQITDPA
jgi:hypothetical protein